MEPERHLFPLGGVHNVSVAVSLVIGILVSLLAGSLIGLAQPIDASPGDMSRAETINPIEGNRTVAQFADLECVFFCGLRQVRLSV